MQASVSLASFAGDLSDNPDTSVKQGARLTAIIGLWLEGPSHRSSNHETNREIAETPHARSVRVWYCGRLLRREQLAVNAGAAKAVTIQGARQHGTIDSRPWRGSSAISKSQKPGCSQLVTREMQAKGVPGAL